MVNGCGAACESRQSQWKLINIIADCFINSYKKSESINIFSNLVKVLAVLTMLWQNRFSVERYDYINTMKKRI